MTVRKRAKEKLEASESKRTAEDRELGDLDSARLSEPSFAKDWLSPEDEEAWRDL